MDNSGVPYHAYKPSGISWLGDVPDHWDMPRLKGYVTNAIDLSRAPIDGELYLALEHVESWTGRFSEAGNGVSFSGQMKRFHAEDVLFGKLRPYLAKVTCPKRNGVCVGEFLVLRPHDANLSSRYLEQLLRSKPAIDAIDSSTFGAKMPRADWQFIGELLFPLPPLPEQAAIVRYLDHVGQRIRRYVAAKRKLIALLEEEKQASSTGRLPGAATPTSASSPPASSGSVTCQNTGRCGEGKRLFSPRRELARPDDIQLSATQAYGVIPQDEYEERMGRRIVKISLHLNQRRHVEVDDFVISMRSFQGGLERAWANGCIRSSYIVLRPAIEADVEFFSYVFKSQAYIQALRSTANFIRDGQDLTFDNFCEVDLPFPPAEEQKKIAVALREATADN